MLTPAGLHAGLELAVEDGRIAAIGPATGGPATELPDDAILAPGFIDLQVNGGGGVQFNDQPTEAGARAIAAAHRRLGTTSLLPTLITDHAEAMHDAADAVRAAAADPESGVLGLHLEGPFLSPLRPGTHDPARIRRMTEADATWLAALPARLAAPVLLTLAPEEVEDACLLQLAEAGLLLCAGHTAAPAARVRQALSLGLRGFTHLFNAMPPLQGREPGPAGAALLDAASGCGIIADGIHVAPEMLRLALRLKPPGTVFLVTDAMAPAGTDMTDFLLYGARIHRRAGRLERDDGTLSGADLDMPTAVRNGVDLLGLDLAEALRMATLYPARFLGVTDRGELAPGLRADLVLLSDGLNVLQKWVGGVSLPE